jgi:ABC-type phosphate/phosphonate transport system substrate-binding protein
MTTTIQPNEESFDKDSRFLTFVINPNFGFSADEEPWSSLLPELGITAQPSKDLAWIKQTMADHEPDLAFISISDFLRSVAKGDQHYRGFAIATSKFTGTTNLPSVLVVRQDDPAQSFADLEGAKYGYINKSCSSSYFPANIVLAKQGKRLDEYVNIVQVKPWQGQIDAVVAKEVRATMVAEDVWKTTPGNAQHTRIIGRYDNAKPALIVARQDLDEEVGKKLLAALVAWMPKWQAVFGAFRPYYYADVQAYFHDLNGLPADI